MSRAGVLFIAAIVWASLAVGAGPDAPVLEDHAALPASSPSAMHGAGTESRPLELQAGQPLLAGDARRLPTFAAAVRALVRAGDMPGLKALARMGKLAFERARLGRSGDEPALPPPPKRPSFYDRVPVSGARPPAAPEDAPNGAGDASRGGGGTGAGGAGADSEDGDTGSNADVLAPPSARRGGGAGAGSGGDGSSGSGPSGSGDGGGFGGSAAPDSAGLAAAEQARTQSEVASKTAAAAEDDTASSTATVLGVSTAGLPPPRPGGAVPKKCCACTGANPDLRWPGVSGSPLVNDMEKREEYVWGERGKEEMRNPVDRFNQPRPECCPCATDEDKQSDVAAGTAMAEAGKPAAGSEEEEAAVAGGDGGAATSSAEDLLGRRDSQSAGAGSGGGGGNAPVTPAQRDEQSEAEADGAADAIGARLKQEAASKGAAAAGAKGEQAAARAAGEAAGKSAPKVSAGAPKRKGPSLTVPGIDEMVRQTLPGAPTPSELEAQAEEDAPGDVSAEAEARSRPDSQRSPWREIVALVEAERQRDKVVAFGKSLDLRAALAALKDPSAHPNPTPARTELDRFRRALWRAVVSVRVKEMLAQRAVEAYNGGQRVPEGSVMRDPAGRSPAEADTATLQQQDRARSPLRSEAAAGAGLPPGARAEPDPAELALSAASARGSQRGQDVHIPQLLGTGPGSRNEGAVEAEARARFQAATGRQPADDAELYGGVDQARGGVATLVCRALAKAEGLDYRARPLSAEQCRELLRTAVRRGHREAAAAFRLLSRGPAQSLCAQLGRLQCHETLQEAIARGHTVTAFALKTLLNHATSRDPVFGRRRFLHAKSRLARQQLLWDAERGSLKRLAVGRTGARSSALHVGKAAARGQGLTGEFGGDTALPVVVREACAGKEGAMTVNCLCARVGPARCSESLFRAYVYGHDDVVQSLQRIRGSPVDGPATLFCKEIGWERCKMLSSNASQLAKAGRSDGRAVQLLWHALHGDHPVAAFDEDESMQRLSLTADVRVLSGGPAMDPVELARTGGVAPDVVNRSAASALPTGDDGVLRDLVDVLRRFRRFHREEAGTVPLEVAAWAAEHGRTDETLDESAARLGLASVLPLGGISSVRHAELFRWLQDAEEDAEAPARDRGVALGSLAQYEKGSIFEYLARPAEELVKDAAAAAAEPVHPPVPQPSAAPASPVETDAAGQRPPLPPAAEPRRKLPADIAHAKVSGDGLVAPPDPAIAAQKAAVEAWDAKRKLIVGVCGPNPVPSNELDCLDLEGSCSLSKRALLGVAARLALQGKDEGDDELFASRNDCESAVDVVSGARGEWRPLNTFVPLPYPGALSHVIKANSFGAIADLLDSGAVSAESMLLAAPRAEAQLPEALAACSAAFPAYAAVGLGEPGLNPPLSWSAQVVAAARAATAAKPAPASLAIPLNLTGAVVESPQVLSAVWHMRSRPTLASGLPKGAVVVGEPKLVTKPASGGKPAQFPVPSALFCPNTVGRPLELAATARAADANTALVGREATSALSPQALGLQWREAKLNNLSHPGLHGYLAAVDSFWQCLPRALDGGGCLGTAGDPGEGPPMAGDPVEGLCNPVTGENCPCFGSESPSSPFECDDEVPRRKRRKRTTSSSKTTRTKNTNSYSIKLKLKDKNSKTKKAKKCDPNPFTNLLFFIFCIILMILEAIMKAIMGFTQISAVGGPATPMLLSAWEHNHGLVSAHALEAAAPPCASVSGPYGQLECVAQATASIEHLRVELPHHCHEWSQAFGCIEWDASMLQASADEEGLGSDEAAPPAEPTASELLSALLGSSAGHDARPDNEPGHVVAELRLGQDTEIDRHRVFQDVMHSLSAGDGGLGGLTRLAQEPDLSRRLLRSLDRRELSNSTASEVGRLPDSIVNSLLEAVHGRERGLARDPLDDTLVAINMTLDAAKLQDLLASLKKSTGGAAAGPGAAIAAAAKLQPPGAAAVGANAHKGTLPSLNQPGVAGLGKVMGALGGLSKLGKLANMGKPNPIIAIFLKLLLLPFSIVRIIPLPLPWSFLALLFYPLVPPPIGFPGGAAPPPPPGAPPTLEAISGAGPAPPPGAKAPLGACTCFCPLEDTGLAALPPLYGHAMVAVDGGRSALMIGGGCVDSDSKGFSGDLGVTGDAWVLRLGVGNNTEISNRLADVLKDTAKGMMNVDDKNDTLANALAFEAVVNSYDRSFWLQPPRKGKRMAHTGHVWWQVGNDRPKVPTWRQKPFGNGGLRMPPRMGHTAVAFDRRLGDGSSVSLADFRRSMKKKGEQAAPAGPSQGEELYDAKEAILPLYKADKGKWAFAEAELNSALQAAIEQEFHTKLQPADLGVLRLAAAAKAKAAKAEADAKAKEGETAEGKAKLLQVGGQAAPKQDEDDDREIEAVEEWQPTPAAGANSGGIWVPLDSSEEGDGWVGYRANASDSLFDVTIVLGGYSGGQVFGDVWALFRFPDDTAKACASPGSDGITCAMSQSPDAAFSTKWVNGADIARLIRRRAVTKKSEEATLTALHNANAKARMDWGGTSGADRRPVHVRDDQPVQWRWEWRDYTDTLKGTRPSARHRHAATSVLGEFMMVIGGEAPSSAVPASDPPPSDVASAASHGAPSSMSASSGGAPDSSAPSADSPASSSTSGQPRATRFLADVHLLHVPTMAWLPASIDAPEGHAMPPRAMHAAAAAGSSVFVFGGVAADGGPLGDLWRFQLPCSLPPPSEAPPGPSAYATPLALLPVKRLGVKCAASTGAAHAQFAMPHTITVRRVRPTGAMPTARFGHQMLLQNQRLLILGGFGAGTGRGSWRSRLDATGLRIDATLLDAGLPSVTKVSPSVLSLSGVDPVTGSSSTRMMIYGRGLGTCPPWGWAWVRGTNRCVAGCKGWKSRSGWAANSADGGRVGSRLADGSDGFAATVSAREAAPDGTAECAEEDVGSWSGNNPAAPAVSIGHHECKGVVWFSPFALSCVIEGRLSDPQFAASETFPIFVTLPDGRNNHAAAVAAVDESLGATLGPEQASGFFLESDTAKLADMEAASARPASWGETPPPGDGLAAVLGLGKDGAEPKRGAAAFLQTGSARPSSPAALGIEQLFRLAQAGADRGAAGPTAQAREHVAAMLGSAALEARRDASDALEAASAAARRRSAALDADAQWLDAQAEASDAVARGAGPESFLQRAARATGHLHANAAHSAREHARVARLAADSASGSLARLGASARRASARSRADADGGAPVALGSRALAPVLRVGAPLLAAVYPPQMVDMPMRGPVILVGSGFGQYESEDSNSKAKVPGKGVVFDLFGTGPPLASAWFGNRPCVRLIVVSDSVAVCACFARGPEADMDKLSRFVERIEDEDAPSLLQMFGNEFVKKEGATVEKLSHTDTTSYGAAFVEARMPDPAWPIDPTVADEAAAPWGRAVFYRRGRPSNLRPFTLLPMGSARPGTAVMVDMETERNIMGLPLVLIGEALKTLLSGPAPKKPSLGLFAKLKAAAKSRAELAKWKKHTKKYANPILPKPGPPAETYPPYLDYEIDAAFWDRTTMSQPELFRKAYYVKGKARLRTLARSCPPVEALRTPLLAAERIAGTIGAAMASGLGNGGTPAQAVAKAEPPDDKDVAQTSPLIVAGKLSVVKAGPAFLQTAASIKEAPSAAGGRKASTRGQAARRDANAVPGEGGSSRAVWRLTGPAGADTAGCGVDGAKGRPRFRGSRGGKCAASESSESEPVCDIRVPALEAQYATHLSDAPGTVITEGCGCGSVLRSAMHGTGSAGPVSQISNADVPGECRRNLAAYGWVLGCVDLARTYADVCGVSRDDALLERVEESGSSASEADALEALAWAAAGTGWRPSHRFRQRQQQGQQERERARSASARFAAGRAGASTLARTRALLANALSMAGPGAARDAVALEALEGDDGVEAGLRGVDREGEALSADAEAGLRGEAAASRSYLARLKAGNDAARLQREGSSGQVASVADMAAEGGAAPDALANDIQDAVSDATVAGLSAQGMLAVARRAAHGFGMSAGDFDAGLLQAGARAARRASARGGGSRAQGVLQASDESVGSDGAAALVQQRARGDGSEGDEAEGSFGSGLPARPSSVVASAAEVLGPALRSQCSALRELLRGRCVALPALRRALPDLVRVARRRFDEADAAASKGLLSTGPIRPAGEDSDSLFGAPVPASAALGAEAARAESDGAVGRAVSALQRMRRRAAAAIGTGKNVTRGDAGISAEHLAEETAGARFASASAASRALATAAAAEAVQLAMEDAGVSGNVGPVTLAVLPEPADPGEPPKPERRPQPPLDVPPLPDSDEAPVASFSRPDAVCFQGRPPTPRVGFGAVALGDTTTFVVYGGLAEVAGDVLKNSLVGGLPRVVQTPKNDTHLVFQLSPAQMAEASMSRFACRPEQSESLRAARLLPDDA
ncbi:hypothetical protein FNF31_01944 [Cafeteria roenbergensis]|uniref:Uncharacterized protein n=1 Tax=Cafeteria roenbergensis TaxID=33653 RepID=A0A5A8DN48_CAFRO|nr:hypothetical protein FNF31_01944 [Cafeteria roenbergensis]